ncbi:MAG TPA: Hsp70 family protein [Herpetosiphonaceae bacterium]|nr:Hsp70 family protein [Herpetosiphonaceae bacterium]
MSGVDILGIDLGTTKSVIAIWDPATQEPRVLQNAEGAPITPSVVAYDDATGRAVVGQPAVDRLLTDPHHVAYSVKRFIGRPPEDQWVRFDREHVSYDIAEDEQHHVVITIGDRRLTPPEISAEVLRKLKDDVQATEHGRPVNKAVISVPAYFNDTQRRSTQQAGELAGLFVPRIIPEPTAAALAFNLGSVPEMVAVYDMGGGTFDISILWIEAGLFKVKAIGGDTHLGGDDFDQTIVDHLLEHMYAQNPDVVPREPDDALKARLRLLAKRAKEALTDQPEYLISAPDLLRVGDEARGIEIILTRAAFDSLIRPFVERSLELMDETLAKARIEPRDLSQILLVGGQTRTPQIRDALQQRYGRPLNTSIEPEEAVARGAAVLGARLCGHLKDRVALWDAVPLSLGLELADGSMDVIIPANEPIPTEKWRRGPQAFTTQRDGQTKIQFNIYQGERPLAIDNTRIGEVILPLVTSRREGEQRVNCLFKVDVNGILTVRAESADSEGKSVEANFVHGLPSVAEVQAQWRELEAHRAEDELTRRILRLNKELKDLRIVVLQRSPEEALLARLDAADCAIQARDADRATSILAELRGAV